MHNLQPLIEYRLLWLGKYTTEEASLLWGNAFVAVLVVPTFRKIVVPSLSWLSLTLDVTAPRTVKTSDDTHRTVKTSDDTHRTVKTSDDTHRTAQLHTI
jgi:hypothetical protein